MKMINNIGTYVIPMFNPLDVNIDTCYWLGVFIFVCAFIGLIYVSELNYGDTEEH